MQFDVVRCLVGPEANQFQSQTDIRQTLLDAATVKRQGESVRVFVDLCHENRWLCFIDRSPIGPKDGCLILPSDENRSSRTTPHGPIIPTHVKKDFL